MPPHPTDPEDDAPSRRLRVTCVIHHLAGGGAERVIAGLASRLAAGHDVTLVTLGDGRDDRHEVDDAVTRIDLDVMSESAGRVRRAVAALGRLRRLRQAVVATRCDVVLSFCDAMNIKTLLAMRGTGIPVVVAERSDPAMQSLGSVGDRLRQRLYAAAAAVVAQTQSQADTLAAMTGRHVDVIPSAVEDPSDSGSSDSGSWDRHAEDSEAPILLGVGRLEDEKGFDRLIEAFAAVTRSRPDFSLTLRIVGEGSRRESLQALAERLGVADRVRWAGWVRPIWPEYFRARWFALPSRYEGFPSALLEAMACGKPCVAVDCESGPREIIDDGRNGWLVPDSVDGLARGIGRLIDDPASADRLGRHAKEVTRRFGWERLTRDFQRVLCSAADQRPSRSR